MRWKLLFVAPLLAAAAAAGVLLLIDRLLGINLARHGGSPYGPVYLLLPSLATAVGAAVFVYRHNARRRALQGAVAGLLSLAIFYAALFAWVSFAG